MRIITLPAIGLMLVIAVATLVGLSPQQVRVPVRPAPATPLRATITIAPTDEADVPPVSHPAITRVCG